MPVKRLVPLRPEPATRTSVRPDESCSPSGAAFLLSCFPSVNPSDLTGIAAAYLAACGVPGRPQPPASAIKACG
jgi:hypothetical protein